MIEPAVFARSALILLQRDPRNYRNFGVYWYFVKKLLKRFYTRDNLSMLGDYSDPSVIARMPAHESLQDAMAQALETYQQNVSFNMQSARVVDPNCEEFTLMDPDAGV